MSSRALRKAQQRAEQERLAALAAAASDPAEPSDDDEADEEPVANTKANIFSMLNAELEEAADDDNDTDDEPTTDTITTTTSTSKPKKKKKKKKSKAKAKEVDDTQTPDDDFDAALESLKSTSISKDTASHSTATATSADSQLQSLLHIDPRSLDSENEMRRLFGRAATRESGAGAHHDPRQQRAQRLASNIGRRNVFVQRGDGWPREGSGGLSMELVERRPDGTTLFQYVHSRAYQDVQRQFNECVRSMDPDRMFTHLSAHPYHISTLLQASHIALTQSTDQAAAQTLIARALHALGRSTHSLFAQALAAGSARVAFHRFEDRELYFAGWRYILSLSRRGLWRTGLEFVRLLLQMDPLRDPLCLVLLVDQYALKSRAPEVLLELAGTPALVDIWRRNPNIAYSTALAHLMAGDADGAKDALSDAVARFPWMLTKLHGSLSEASGGSLPEGLWGCLPPDDTSGLLAELYVARMSDLWNIPEHASFLLATISAMGKVQTDGKAPDVVYAGERLRDLARHVFLMDPREGRTLIGYLPRALREDQGYTWDVLPPTGAESSYQKEMEAQEERAVAAAATAGGGNVGRAGMFQVFLRSLLPDYTPPQPAAGQVERQVMMDVGGDEAPFEVGEADLQATLIAMVDEGVGFPNGLTVPQRASALMEVGLVPAALRPWFTDRYGPIIPADVDDGDGDEQPPSGDEEDGQEEAEEETERDGRAIDRLVQILGTGDRSTLQMRVERMFEGQGAEMADVRRRVEERLGLR
ncbi:hypothetical protein Dda_5803 [Drechslerella dactyloides]|uniref:Transcription factor 25 n=1 Tax=Drechslerella dactyloides TaxID=74499 RepID=A0AAD6NJD5_DREDA|nr:hypothetical protein Dda_5803 [Drechslerella dactyloides]